MTPAEPNAFLAAALWVQAVLLGPVATSIAVIAVASIGLMMLSGRMNVRRGATVLIGCFILFGAGAIAQGLRGLSASVGGDGPPAQVAPPPELEVAPIIPPQPEPPASNDPYAGASLRR